MDDISKVRLLIGDTAVPQHFTDVQIQAFLDMAGGSVNLAAAKALEAWAASYATHESSERIGDYWYTQEIVKQMLALAKSLKEAEATTPSATWAEFNFTGVEES